MIGTTTDDMVEVTAEAFIPGSGPWELTRKPIESIPLKYSQSPRTGLSQIIAISLALSTLTFVADPWLQSAPKNVSTTHMVDFETISRRTISIADARQIALKILVEAEAERLRIADEEAVRGIDWEQTQ